MTGWISLHRRILEWEWYDDINVCRLFIHCLLKANHKDKKWKGIDIKRGQFITSLDKLSRETGLSVSQIRTCLKKLKSTHEIASKSHTQHTVITMISYDSYQGDSKQDSKPVACESQASDKQVATTNNDNNEKNEKNENKREDLIDSSFNKFWGCYHKKQGKSQAMKAFKATIKRESVKDVIQFTDMLVDDCKNRIKSGQFGFDNLNASTYLNNNRWEDEIQTKDESKVVEPDWMRGLL